MLNTDIAKILYEIADMLEMKGVNFKPQAYRAAAQTIEGLKKMLRIFILKKGKKGLNSFPELEREFLKK